MRKYITSIVGGSAIVLACTTNAGLVYYEGFNGAGTPGGLVGAEATVGASDLSHGGIAGGNAIQFTGAQESAFAVLPAAIGGIDAAAVAAGPSTVMFWAKHADNSHTEGWAFRINGAAGDSGHLIVMNKDGTVATEVRRFDPGGSLEWVDGTVGRMNVGQGEPAAGGVLTVDEWTHVALAYDSQNINLFIDGVEAGSSQNLDSTFDLQTGDGLMFGASGANQSRSWAGTMDEIKIFDERLDAAGVSAAMAIPEPSTLTLFAFLGSLLCLRRWRR